MSWAKAGLGHSPASVADLAVQGELPQSHYSFPSDLARHPAPTHACLCIHIDVRIDRNIDRSIYQGYATPIHYTWKATQRMTHRGRRRRRRRLSLHAVEQQVLLSEPNDPLIAPIAVRHGGANRVPAYSTSEHAMHGNRTRCRPADRPAGTVHGNEGARPGRQTR